MKVFLVNSFFKPVTAIVECSLPTRLISCSVVEGFGMFWRRVMANVV